MKQLNSRTLTARITSLNNALSPARTDELVVNIVFQSLNHNPHHITKLWEASHIPQTVKAQAYKLGAHKSKREGDSVTMVLDRDKEKANLELLFLDEKPEFVEVEAAVVQLLTAERAKKKEVQPLAQVSAGSLDSQLAKLKERAGVSNYDAIASQMEKRVRELEVLRVILAGKAASAI